MQRIDIVKCTKVLSITFAILPVVVAVDPEPREVIRKLVTTTTPTQKEIE